MCGGNPAHSFGRGERDEAGGFAEDERSGRASEDYIRFCFFPAPSGVGGKLCSLGAIPVLFFFASLVKLAS